MYIFIYIYIYLYKYTRVYVCVCVYIFIYMSYKLVLVVFFLSVLVYFSLSKAARLSNALTSSAGFGLCSYFFFFSFFFFPPKFIYLFFTAVRLSCWKQRLNVPKFNFISCLFLVFSLENGSSSALATKVGYLHTALWLACALMGLPNHAVSVCW